MHIELVVPDHLWRPSTRRDGAPKVILTGTSGAMLQATRAHFPSRKGRSLTICRIRKDRKCSQLLLIPSHSRAALPEKSKSARETCHPSSPLAIARLQPSAQAIDALGAALATYVFDGADFPVPSAPLPGERLVAPPPLAARRNSPS